jgi:hypothetical protein
MRLHGRPPLVSTRKRGLRESRLRIVHYA